MVEQRRSTGSRRPERAEGRNDLMRDVPVWVLLAIPLGLMAALVIFFDVWWPKLW